MTKKKQLKERFVKHKKIPVAEQRRLVSGAIAKQVRFLNQTKSTDNPQIVAMQNRAQGKLEAYEGVLHMLRDGDTCLLRIDTEFLE